MRQQLARALVEVAQTQKIIPEVLRDLLRVQEAMTSDARLVSDLQDMAWPLEQRQAAVRRALTRSVHQYVINTLLILQRERLLTQLKDFVRLVVRLAAQQTQHHIVYVTTAMELADHDRIVLTRALHKLLGGTHELYERVDASLLGGLTLETGDQRFEASVRGKLDQLKSSLYAA